MLKHLPFTWKRIIVFALNNTFRKSVIICTVSFLICFSAFAQNPVVSSRPRIFLDPATKVAMFAKKNNADKNWTDLLATANKYLPHTVIAWDPISAGSSAYYNTGDVFYSYCGSNWEEAALILGFAHQLTKTNNAGANATAYSNKMLALADVIIKGYADYPPNANYQPNIFQYNSSYATRHVGKTIAIIYDWCYDELGATRKAALLHVMKDWFTFMSAKPYVLNQIQEDPTGNYFVGHLICAAYMGYAIGSDDPMSQKMIDFARQRAIGTPGSLNPNTATSAETAYNYFTQSVKGGLPSGASKTYLGPKTILSAPQKDGIPVQGWSYGGATTNFLIDYYYLVKSSTGEDLMQSDASFKTYMAKTAEALVHAYTPNNFQYDNSNDNGSFVGCITSYGLPLRLSAIMEGTPEGPAIEYFYKTALQPINLATYSVGYPETTWEKMLYSKTRASAAYNYKPYYPIPTVNTYNAVPINTGLNKFYMRSDWTPAATWAALEMGIAAYDQHNHNNAGHFKIVRGDNHDGDDMLLVGANEVPASGGNGINGSTNYSYWSSQSNTLFLNDGTDYDPPYPDPSHTVGGQTSFGYDEPTHQEQNDKFSYFRSDLTSAYYISYYNPDTTKRSLRYYYRSFLYLRNSNVFVVYDNLLAKNSTNAAGQYKKHLRWHFMNQPVVNGSNITATMDNSKLFIHTVLPAATTVAAVDENNNPDNVYGSSVNYAFNTKTWRAEVSVANNPLKQDIVTVLQPGAKTATEMVTSAIASTQNNMEGSLITVNGKTEVVLFNNSIAKYPVPVATVSYNYTSNLGGTHTLCGLDPDKKYAVTYTSGLVTVTKSAAGTETASPSGVLSFSLQTQPLSSNANMNKVTLSQPAVLSATTGPANYNYNMVVSSSAASATLTVTSQDADASIAINGSAGIKATVSTTVAIGTVPAVVTIVITAADGTTKRTYQITVTPSHNANLSKIVLSQPSALSTTTGPANYNYNMLITSSSATATLTITAQDAGANVSINGAVATAGTAWIALPVSSTPVISSIVITAADGTTKRTYQITSVKAPSTNANLNKISLSQPSVLSAVSGPANYNYKMAISSSAATAILSLTTQEANAVISVNGATGAMGTATTSIAISTTPVVISIAVTAADGKTKLTYQIIATKTGGVTTLAAITKNNLLNLVQKPDLQADVSPEELIVKQGLSPNGDGINDLFIIEGINTYTENKVSIMNRDGVLVYEIQGYDNQSKVFNGHSKNGALLLPGTYFYAIEYKKDKEAKKKTGYIVIKY